MNLTDTHAHLYWDSFKDDFDQMIQRALDTGVTTLINVGVDVEKSREALRQVQEINWPSNLTVYSTIGIHPHEAVKYSRDGQTLHDRSTFVQKDIDSLEKIYKSNPKKVVAVGECGLDFLFDSNPDWITHSLRHSELDSESQQKKLQRQLFQAQIDLAKELNLPLIVHCRDDRSQDPQNSEAWDMVLEMVADHPTVLHCYSGLPKTTNLILSSTNLLVSFAATITYPKNEYLREAAKLLPIERIVLETDCPFLPPQNKRGQRNEPANILEIAQLVADLKALTFEEVAKQTVNNSRQILSGKAGTLAF